MYVNVSVRDVLWQGTPNKEEKKKEVVQFRVGEEKDVGILEDVQYFKMQVQKLLLLLSSLHI